MSPSGSWCCHSDAGSRSWVLLRRRGGLRGAVGLLGAALPLASLWLGALCSRLCNWAPTRLFAVLCGNSWVVSACGVHCGMRPHARGVASVVAWVSAGQLEGATHCVLAGFWCWVVGFLRVSARSSRCYWSEGASFCGAGFATVLWVAVPHWYRDVSIITGRKPRWSELAARASSGPCGRAGLAILMTRLVASGLAARRARALPPAAQAMTDSEHELRR